MNGFQGDEVPGWLLDAFDERTTLPRGPLERFPVPLEGVITGGRVLMPKSGSPARHIVNVACNETVRDAVRFLNEYLPLSGYVVFGHGVFRAPRTFSPERAEHDEILLVRCPPYVGSVLVRPGNTQGTAIEADLAHPSHPQGNEVVDFSDPRSHPQIHWERLDD
jgi:hypothetical protein